MTIDQKRLSDEVQMPEFEFHVSRKARQKYQFDETLFTLNGNVILADFAAARRFAEQYEQGTWAGRSRLQ